MVLGDGVLVDDKCGLAIVPEGGDRYLGQSATLERALTTEILQCLMKGRGWERGQLLLRLSQPFFNFPQGGGGARMWKWATLNSAHPVGWGNAQACLW